MDISIEKILIYLLIVNILTYFLFWKDKMTAGTGGWRVPEATLLIFTLIGGTPAAIFAKKSLRHKTKKKSFKSKFFVILILQFFALVFLGFNWFVLKL